MAVDELLFGSLFQTCPESWDVVPFQDAVDFQEGPGILAKDFHDSGVPLLRLSGVQRSMASLDGCNYLDPEKVAKKWNHFRLKRGDLVISTSATIGMVSEIGAETEGVVAYTGLIRLRPRTDRIWPGFIKYFAKSSFFVQQAEGMASGSVLRHFGPSHLRQMAFPVPPLAEQKTIAQILGSLDDKIELNRRMNATLEAMARALFQSWFVDFDPIRAKLDGRKPAGLDATTAALFPAHFQDSPLGHIPQGWTVGTIEDAAALIIDYRGRTPKKMGSDWSETGIPAVSAKNVKAGRLVRPEMFNFVSEELYERWMKHKLAIGDILMTSEAPLGELYYLALDARYCLSQRVFGLRANPARCESTFLYYWLESPSCQTEIINRGTGTTVEGIRQSELRKVAVLLPPLPIQVAAAKFLADWTEQIHRNEEQSRTLATLRDTLLPKLLSGDIHVANVEEEVASV
ncbi:Type-1 restriction enzyme EcoKI specificity protein [Anaerolineales bacterium]|nr:Type-1 restriction enzyme EcoKI specificity protein [Anaerolineales bacterium]